MANSIAPSTLISCHFPASVLAHFQYVLHKTAGMTFENHKCGHILQGLPPAPQILLESLIWLLGPCMTWPLSSLGLSHSPLPLIQGTSNNPCCHPMKGLTTYPSAWNLLPPAPAPFAFNYPHILHISHSKGRLPLDQIPGYTLSPHNVLFLYRNTSS